jgi:hypothetical protein
MNETVREIAERLGVSEDDLLMANDMANLCGDAAGFRFLDWQRDRELYFSRVESGYYDKLENETEEH